MDETRLTAIEDGLERHMFNSEPAPDVVEELVAALREAQSALALMRSLSINPTIPEGLRTIMRDALDPEQHDQPDA